MDFKDALKTKIILGDGATGTFLQKRGLEPGGCPELMNSEKQDAVIEMASRYFESGSDFVLTNTFGGSPFMLKKYGFEFIVYQNDTGIISEAIKNITNKWKEIF